MLVQKKKSLLEVLFWGFSQKTIYERFWLCQYYDTGFQSVWFAYFCMSTVLQINSISVFSDTCLPSFSFAFFILFSCSYSLQSLPCNMVHVFWCIKCVWLPPFFLFKWLIQYRSLCIVSSWLCSLCIWKNALLNFVGFENSSEIPFLCCDAYCVTNLWFWPSLIWFERAQVIYWAE